MAFTKIDQVSNAPLYSFIPDHSYNNYIYIFLHRVPSLIEAMQELHTKMNNRYHRIFVAEYGGRLAGVCQIKLKEDR